MTSARYGSLPFQEQHGFFRQKVNLPTDSWTDIWQGMHSRAFVVAGARGQVLTDLRSAVQSAIEEGKTLAEFRKEFDQIVARTGWAYNGGRNWRTRIIYETNLRQSYNAGREAQIADPALRKARPYGLYRHGGSAEPRPQHLAWDGLVLPLDDPWWETHTPQNGWGCSCKKFTVSERDIKRLGLKVADKAPAIEWEEKTVGSRGPSPRTVRVPAGIDPGFAYNPGTAAWGRQLSEDAMASWKAQGRDAWELLTPAGPETFNRPLRIPIETTPAKLGKRLTTSSQVEGALEKILDGKEKVYQVAGQATLVNAKSLAQHIDPARAEYLPLLPELLEKPFEVWAAFERHKGTGKVVLRTRLIKAVRIDKKRGLLLVANARGGVLEAWTFIPTTDFKYLERQRRGVLVYGKK